MKIGIYNPYLDSLSGGERYMLIIASCLQDKHEVVVFWDDKRILEQAKDKLSINLSKVKIVPNIFEKKRSLIKSVFSKSEYDIVFVLSDGSIPNINAKAGVLHFQRPFANVGGRSIKNSVKLRNYKAVICNSRYTKKYIDKEFGLDSQVVYPPVSIDKFKSGKKENLIISIGRFHEFKKHELMINAFKKFSIKYSDWKLVILGGLLKADNAYIQILTKQIKNANVQLIKNAPFSSLKDHLSKASIYWHAAGHGEDENNHPENFEHFGIAPIEAMASGCIPIAFKGGGLPEIITDCQNGYLWETKEELIRKTSKVIQDESDILRIRHSAISSSKDYDEAVFVKKIQNLVSSIS